MSSFEAIAVQASFHRLFESYGVLVRIESDLPELVDYGLEIAHTALVSRITTIQNDERLPDLKFFIGKEGERHYFVIDNETRASPEREIDFSRLLNTMIRIHVAERARGWVFIHAGVVGYRGKAIILPAASHIGKTTLVSELLRLGAEYFSDEYAVLDAEGRVHPYPRDLSVRPPGSEIPVQVPPAEFGGKIASEPAPVGLVVLTKYDPEAEFIPERLSMGIGIMETVPEIIPIRFNTDFSLKVLNTAFRSAIIVKSLRGEAQKAAPSILSYFDENLT